MRFGPAPVVLAVTAIAICVIAAVGAGRASAAWHAVDCSALPHVSIPCWEWHDDGEGGPVGKRLSEAEFERLARAQAAIESEVAPATQGAGIDIYRRADETFPEVQERIARFLSTADAAGPEAEGAILGEAIDAGAVGAIPTVPFAAAAAAGAGALYLGWKIGGWITNLFGGEPDGDPVPAAKQHFVASRLIKRGGPVVTVSGDASYTSPISGQIAEWSTSAGASEGAVVVEVEGGCTGSGEGFNSPANPPVVEQPAGYQLIETKHRPDGNEARAKLGCEVWLDYWVAPLAVAGSIGQGVEAGTMLTTTSAAKAPSPQTMIQVAEEGMQNPYYDPLNKAVAEDEELTGVAPGEGVPVKVPAPGAHELYTDYDAQLRRLGLRPEAVALGENSIKYSKGPEEVVTVNPVAGTELDPGEVVKVRYNPADAPEAGTHPEAGTGTGTEEGPAEEGGTETGPWSPPAIHGLDLSPIADLHVGCGTFPFGIFCWLKDGLTSWGPGGECPSISLPFVSFDEGQSGHFDGAKLESSTCGFEPAMQVIRPTLVVLATLSIAAMFAYAALGIGGQAGADD